MGNISEEAEAMYRADLRYCWSAEFRRLLRLVTDQGLLAELLADANDVETRPQPESEQSL
jgi:hypothetical protein